MNSGRVVGSVLLATLGILSSACDARRSGDESPYADEVAEAVPEIEKATGLKFKTPPKIEAKTKDEVRSFLMRKFNEDQPAKEIVGLERAYKRFGLLPDTLRLREYMLELLTEQVVGYYDPSTKVLYVVEGSPDDRVAITVTHELVHALQDQYLNLDSIQKIVANNDRQVAAQAVIEGQATYEQIRSMLGGNSDFAAALPGGWERVRDVIREAQSSMPVFSAAPQLIQETLIFPYLSGTEFMRRFKAQRPGAMPYDQMPLSTEQIMHESAYFGTRDDPSTVTLPPLSAATEVYQNNLGEFETRLFLFHYLQDQNAAVRGAAGWDGDRYVLFDTPNGEGIVWVSVWDTAVDAGEFRDLVDAAVQKRFKGATSAASSEQDRVYSSGDRRVSVLAREIAGRPCVVYLDTPAALQGMPVDLTKVGVR